MQNSLAIAKDFDVDLNMVYVIAAFHDLGLAVNREQHHYHSKIILLSDQTLLNFFTKDDINIMGKAVEDHRASNTNEPRSIYGKIVSEADLDLNAERIIRRILEFGMDVLKIDHKDVLLQEAQHHLKQKYGQHRKFNLWINHKNSQKALNDIQSYIDDTVLFEEYTNHLFETYFSPSN
ncbi:HD domain-containing protein [Aerococcaceae bacterium DSM 109653]|uniref:HD domain-containing protein n=1 Tax=Fundicoccus ignavus TaxID=2664442 RepID=A0A844BQ07_9LACT|nr:HD domain-containing protein [Fundicoccus ignavus]